MAESVQISCINMTDRMNPHERISHVGGTNPNGTSWKLPQPDAIVGVEAGKWLFHVDQPAGHRVDVIVRRARTATSTSRPPRTASTRTTFWRCRSAVDEEHLGTKFSAG